MAYSELQEMLRPENHKMLLNFLTEKGLMPASMQCEYCGGNMKQVIDEQKWYWKCSRRVNGIACSRGKKSVRKGTIFDKSKLTTQQILLIFWHFVHGLSESQCATYTNITASCNNTVVKYYRMCREICNEWFWDPRNTPKLGGFGTIVEMDESYFVGKPKMGIWIGSA